MLLFCCFGFVSFEGSFGNWDCFDQRVFYFILGDIITGFGYLCVTFVGILEFGFVDLVSDVVRGLGIFGEL